MTVPTGVVTAISDGASDLIGMIWEIVPVLIPIALVFVAVGFIPKLLKRVGK